MVQAIDCGYSIQGDGPPLFLIHGIGASRDTWSKAVEVLANHFTVISYDLRGHGFSPVPSDEFGLDELVADLEALRAKLGVPEAHFAGHSLGGMIAPAYARIYPARVLSLGLISTAAFRTEEDSTKVLNVVHSMRDQGIPNILPTLTDRWFTDEFIAKHPEIVEARLKQVISTNAEVFLNVFEIYARTEMGPWLHEIEAPSLILTGENDGGCNPRLNRQIDTAMPSSKLVILPDYKHSLLLEAGDIVAREIKHFVIRR